MHFWGKPYLLLTDYPFNLLLDSICVHRELLNCCSLF